MRCRSSGSTGATIAIIGEAPGSEEEAQGLPFVGASGQELDRMLKDSGLLREALFLTNVTHERPPNNEISNWISEKAKAPDGSFINYRNRWVKPFIRAECERLYGEIRAVQPNVVLTLGGAALWALCPQTSVSKWRGSHLTSDAIPGLKVIPAYHPAFILRSYKERAITVQDFRRAKREAITPLSTAPKRTFGVRPSYGEARSWLERLLGSLQVGPVRFTCDLEIFQREILCVGIGLSSTSAFCIPLLWTKGWYWSSEEHVEVTNLLRSVLLHPNAQVINQNLSFDIQYLFWRFYMRPKAHFDTMIAQNVLYSGLPKDLAYLASMYCDHYIYWKDDGKFWVNFNDQDLWHYNCLDCVYTFEVYEKQVAALGAASLTPQMDFQMKTFENLMGMMLRGVKVNEGNKMALLGEIEALIRRFHEEVEYLTGRKLTGDKAFSPKQLAGFFYTDLKLQTIHNREGKVTCDDEALKKIARKNLWLRPLTDRINMVRSYGTAVDVCKKKTDWDSRWRTNYNIAGTTTYRLSSSENPLDSGVNLQNLTLGRDILK